MNDGLKTSQAGLDLITKWEGLKLQTYICPAGKPTIGVGHVVLPGENFSGGITKEKALEILAKDVERFEEGIRKYITVPLTQNQFDALVCFTFNVGTGGLNNTGVQKAVNSGAFDTVPAKLEEWAKARVNGELKVLPGLLARRKSEGQLFLGVVEAPTVHWTKESLKAAQEKLKAHGLYTSGIDGLWGPGTEKAVKAFASSSGVGAGSNPKQGVPQAFLDALLSS